MKKLTKKLNQLIKSLESKGLDQLHLMETVKLNGYMKDLNTTLEYDLDQEKKEIVEVLIEDINNVLVKRLELDLVADTKTDKSTKSAPKKTNKTKTNKTTNKDSKSTKSTDKSNKSTTDKTKTDKPNKPNKSNKTKTEDKKSSLKDVLKYKSLIEMTLDDNTHYVYVVDIEVDFKDVLVRSTDNTSLVIQLDSQALDTFTYTEPSGDKWTLTYKGQLK